MDNEKLLDSIDEAVNLTESTLQCDDSGEDFINFITRENGCVGEEEYGQEDYQDAVDTMAMLHNKFPTMLSMNIDTFDEWVYLNVSVL